jgi:elongation factor Ts
MIEITAKMVNALRESTGAPLMKCKAALTESGGDLARAEVILRNHGVPMPSVDEAGNQGYIAVYIHPGNQIVGLVELASTTDFAARSEEFRTVANELAMQVAASSPVAISVDSLPSEVRENEVRIVRAQIAADPKMAGKPDSLREEIVRNKVAKSLEERCLLTQAYIRDPKIRVSSLVDGLKIKIREAVYVRRIARWRVGETL